MRLRHRRVHRLIWPLLAAVVLMLALAALNARWAAAADSPALGTEMPR
jgi:hypothetical protein